MLRPYQVEANTAIEQAVRERKRQVLVAMATGTGKTFTLVNEIYRLMKSGAARRILFLVDRRALAAGIARGRLLEPRLAAASVAGTWAGCSTDTGWNRTRRLANRRAGR